jgi:peptide chain release factor 2
MSPLATRLPVDQSKANTFGENLLVAIERSRGHVGNQEKVLTGEAVTQLLALHKAKGFDAADFALAEEVAEKAAQNKDPNASVLHVLAEEVRHLRQDQSFILDVKAMLRSNNGHLSDRDVLQVLDDVARFDAEVRKLEMARMLSGETDKNNAFVNLSVGQGGADAQEFTEMLLRMYLRYAEKRGYLVEKINIEPADPSGLKSASILVKGEYAYGFLKAERGVHRLVRMSPFSVKRETSFAGVDVVPEVDDDIDIVINPADLDWKTMRSGGSGGQHVNKTESAVQLTHLPTRIQIRCEQERSQIQNRERAMKMLKAQLYDREVLRRLGEKDKLEAQKMEASFGSQIRNYVMQPYQVAKDLRSGHETTQVQNVLDGEIQGFMEAYLLHLDAEKRAKAS